MYQGQTYSQISSLGSFLPLISQTTADMEHMFPRLLCLCLCCFRQEFGSDQCPDLTREVYLQDIHCVGSLCKLYFRELPNPLLTYELYEKFTVSGFPLWLLGGMHGWAKEGFSTKITIIILTRWMALS